MIDDRIYKILLSSITKDMKPENKNLHKSLIKYQNEIIKIHRTVCLLPYYMFVIECKKQQQQQQNSQLFLPLLSDVDLISSLIRPKEISTFPVLSMMVQESSYLMSYLQNNPSLLAREVIDSKNYLEKLDYYHLMFQIVPSIYGYFHSLELLTSASKFYQSVIDLISDNPKDSIRILQPFLNSPATYRYIEYTMTEFFKKIIISKSFNNITEICFDDKNSYSYREYLLHTNKNTKQLLYYLTKGISLLPDEILVIFRQIKEKYNDKWTIKHWYKLVFSIFINPHVTRWARCHFLNIDEITTVKPLNFINPYEINFESKSRASSFPRSTVRSLPKSNVSSLPQPFFSVSTRNKKHKLDLINDILTNILNDIFKRDLDFFLESLCSVQSSFNTPKMYKCFNESSVRYFMMTNDLIVLANFLTSRNVLPSFVKNNLFREVPDDYKNGLFYMTIYESPSSEKVVKIENPIVFSQISIDPEIVRKFDHQNEYRSRLASLESLAYNNDDDGVTFALEKSVDDPQFHQYVKTHIAINLSRSAESFEEYIELRRLLDEVEKWNHLSSSCQIFLLLAYLYPLRRIPAVFDFLPNKVKLLNQLAMVEEKELQEQLDSVLCFSSEWDMYIQNLVKKRISIVKKKNNLNDDENELEIDGCCQFPFISDPYSKSGTDTSGYLTLVEKLECCNKSNFKFPLFFLKALSTFSMIPLVSLPEKYEVFMKFLEIIDNFFPKDDNTLFLMLIKQISGSLLMEIFIELSTVAIHNDVCFNFIPIIEMKRWQIFENLIYETVSENDDMFQKILKCQMYFQEEFMSLKNLFSNM